MASESIAHSAVLQCFRGFLRRKKKRTESLVLNLVAISKASLIFISILWKITLKQVLIQRPFVTFE